MRYPQILLLIVIAGCGSTRERTAETPRDVAVAPAEDSTTSAEPEAPASLEGWGSERIALPPAFAPGMPAGDELLLFAPGMFDAEAEDYWSYVFVMRLEQGDMRSDQLAEVFEQYYDGLIAAVGKERGIEGDPASVMLLKRGDGDYVANVSLIDAFVTMERIELRAVIRADSSFSDSTYLEVLVSPQPEGHPVWERLEVAVGLLEL